MHENDDALVVANFIQFDMDWGHRNDVSGFRQGLMDLDKGMERIIASSREGDMIFITADHGNDPTTPSTDHSREHVPILAYQRSRPVHDLGTRETFADLAKTAANHLSIEGIRNGTDFFENRRS